MNLGQARIAVRERSTAEIVDLGCRAPFSLGAGLYARLGAVTVLPAAALCVTAFALGVSTAWLWLIAFGCFAWVQGPFTLAASRLMFSPAVSLRSVLGSFGRLSFRYTLAKVMGAFLLAGGAVLVLAVPIVLARVLYLVDVTLVEGTRLGPSYRRSARLNQNRIGSALAVWIALAGIACGFVVCAHVLIVAVGENLLALDPVSELWNNGPHPLSCVGLLVAAPFVATTRFLAYIDCRTRREAWDVQVDFMRLAASLERTA